MLRSRLFARLVLASALLAPALAWAAPTIIYVVRHAEKTAEGKDPELTAQGQARAHTLGRMLGKTGIAAIFSTPTRRTLQTAQPLAAQSGLAVQTYDAAKPGAMIDQVKALTGPVLVVGHSNTVPELVKLLGGVAGAPIADDEFDRLYQLIVAADGSVTTVLLTSVAAPL
ncbi:MAG: histidine phosphatase family protein [Massilia sp.]|nr:histidine phosphatase family protein [Massilia sp.]